MPATRKYVNQNQEESQVLLMDSINPFIVNDNDEWQFLFGPSTELSSSFLKLTIATQFNVDNFDGIKLIAYLFEEQTGSVSSISSIVFSIYKVISPEWNDVFIGNFNGIELPNSYMYTELTTTDLGGIELDGETTLLIEAFGTRLGKVYRTRLYVNHLGISDSFLRLKREVDYLSITKKDE